MKYIVIPKSVDMLNLAGERWKEQGEPLPPLTFVDFMFGKGAFHGRLADVKFGTMKGILAVCAIQASLRELLQQAGGADNLGGHVLAIEDDHWLLLKAATEDPSGDTRYIPMFHHACKPFMVAITEAKDTRPSVADSRVANGGATMPAMEPTS